MWLFAFLLLVSASSASSVNDVILNAQDPIDMVAISGDKIYFKARSTEGLTFGEYLDFCQRNKLRTASILSAAEHQAVKSFIVDNNWGWNMWLGGWDINHEGKFTWFETAQEFPYAEWHSNPIGGDFPVYNCVFISSRSGGAKFNDVPCATARFVPLCEARLI